MNDRRTNRLLGPITIGSALVGVSLGVRGPVDRGDAPDSTAMLHSSGGQTAGDTRRFTFPHEQAGFDYAPPVAGSAAEKPSGGNAAVQAELPAARAPLPTVLFGPAQWAPTSDISGDTQAQPNAISQISDPVASFSRVFDAAVAPSRKPIIAQQPAADNEPSRTVLASQPASTAHLARQTGPLSTSFADNALPMPTGGSAEHVTLSFAADAAAPDPVLESIPDMNTPIAEVEVEDGVIATFAPVTADAEAAPALDTLAEDNSSGSAAELPENAGESIAMPIAASEREPLLVAAPPEIASAAAPPTAAATSPAPPMPEAPAPSVQDTGVGADAALFGYEDELILQVRVEGSSATDTIIAYGNRQGVYLSLGELARLLDLAIRVSDDGHYANGWFLSPERTVTINLRNGTLTTPAGIVELDPATAQAFDGELFLRTDVYGQIFPLKIQPDLRSQAVIFDTLEPFPFEERMRRQAERARLNSRGNAVVEEDWPRAETPFLPLSAPIVDLELRAVSDSARGTRGEGDIRLAGDLAWLTAQAYFTATSDDGLTAALIELGRRDPDGTLLGPLQATEFQLGDVASTAMPLGLRGASGRGAYVSNQPFQSVSVFDQIDLRGVLQDGYEVELYRNDILLGSTRRSVNGQYEFLQVPVDYGLNILRLVFYGPQGQRREEVRRISVGDGRLSPGELVYTVGAVERGVNLLGVRGPDFRRDDRFGDWQGVGELSYGISSAITAVGSAAFYEDEGAEKWIGTLGVRTGIGALALSLDAGVSSQDGRALGAGLGGRALGGSFKLSHFEYGGGFVDEVRAIGRQPLRRATDLDYNASLRLSAVTSVPLSVRARRIEYADGRRQANASLRASTRFSGILASNTLAYNSVSSRNGADFTQVSGALDISTLGRGRTQLRGSVGYRIQPDLRLTQIGAEINHAIDDRTVVRGGAAYAFERDSVTIGASGIRKFDRFTAAFDGQYDFGNDSYSVALRIGISLGRDPLDGRIFTAPPGWASQGAVAVRAFQDLDGDGLFGPDDTPLPDVTVSVTSNAAVTDERGFARLGQLGSGNRAVVQVDPSSLPDILMAPVERGVEIVPRAGRIHVADFPIVALSEVEGTVLFAENGGSRGVSGLRLQLAPEEGEPQNLVRTERGGYFFFERVMPGTYRLIIDPEQAQRLNLCLAETATVDIPATGDIIQQNLTVMTCEGPPVPM